MIAHLLRDLEAALRARLGDTDAERLDRAADVLTRYAIQAGDRESSNLAALIATDLRDLAARREAT